MSQTKYIVRLLRVAEEDLTGLATYIAADRPSDAEALAIKIEKNLTLLSKDSCLGRVPNEEELKRLGYHLCKMSFLVFVNEPVCKR